MQNVTRYIKKPVRTALLLRSNGFCECCGTDTEPDKHHIYDFALGGGSTLANLIVLCQTCHKQLPKYLDKKQQIQLQNWHNNSNVPNLNVNHGVHTEVNSFVMGSNVFEKCKCIFRLNKQNIITPRNVNGRFYVNIIMLDQGFQNQLLVLDNRIIKNKKAKIITDVDSVMLIVENKETFKIYRADNKVIVNLNIVFNGTSFEFNESSSKFPGVTMTRCKFVCNTAIDYEFIEKKWAAKLCAN
ncbi:HNH endonuclease [Patescibacteria group bacterium]|nr:HNH endonuclease [Patescibacteria group bacterium]